MGTKPRIGITVAHDDGNHPTSVYPGVSVHFVPEPYAAAIVKAGGVPLLLPLTGSETVVDVYMEAVDGLLLSGGGGVAMRRYPRTDGLPGLRDLAPERYDFEAMLVTKGLARDVPMLGICRGHQLLAEAAGGRLIRQIEGTVEGALDHNVRDAPLGRHPVHAMTVEPGTLLHHIVQRRTIRVNSLHRQAVETVPPPFIVSGRAEDGVVEAVESTAHRFVLGLQSHPELMVDEPAWDRLFRMLVKAAAGGTPAVERAELSPPVPI